MEPYIARHIRNYYKDIYDDEYINFLIWMSNIEKIVYAKIKCSLDDIPDEDYYVCFEDGVTYENMAKLVIKNNSC